MPSLRPTRASSRFLVFWWLFTPTTHYVHSTRGVRPCMVGPARCVPGDPLKGLGRREPGGGPWGLGALLARLSPPSLWWPQVDVKHVRNRPYPVLKCSTPRAEEVNFHNPCLRRVQLKSTQAPRLPMREVGAREHLQLVSQEKGWLILFLVLPKRRPSEGGRGLEGVGRDTVLSGKKSKT